MADFSFLDEFDGILEMEELEGLELLLRSVHMVLFSRYSPVPSDLSVEKDKIQDMLRFHFGQGTMVQELTVPNKDPKTRGICPYFHVVCEVCDSSGPVNHLLEHFLVRVNKAMATGPHMWCEKAVVYGVSDFGPMAEVVDVPFEYSLLVWSDRMYQPHKPSERLPLAELEIPLHSACITCAASRLSCNHVMPCSRCRNEGKDCMISFAVEYKRCANSIQTLFLSGVYTPSLLARSLLHMQGETICKKPLLSRADALHTNTYLWHHFPFPSIDWTFHWQDENMGSLSMIPESMRDMIKGHDLWKVEWFSGGEYVVKTSDRYAEEIMGAEEMITYGKRFKVPPKFVDTCGLFDDLCFRWWIETIMEPGKIHDVQRWVEGVELEVGLAIPTHLCYFRKAQEVGKVNVKMMSVLAGADKMVTVTRLSRSQVMVMV